MAVFGFAGAFEQTRDFAELAAHLIHHVHGGAAYALHGKGGEHHGDHGADEEGGEYVGFENVDAVDAGEVYVSGEQTEGGKGCRSDGETFADGGGGVAHGVEYVGAFTDFFGEFAHFGDTAGVVGNGAESVDGELHGRGGHHGGSGNGHTVETCQAVSGPDGGGEQHDRDPGRHHARGQTGDHVGGVACARLFNDVHHGLFAHAGVVFGNDGDDCANGQTDDNGQEYVEAAHHHGTTSEEIHGHLCGKHPGDDRVASHQGKDDAHPVAAVEGALYGVVVGFAVVFHAYHLHAYDGEQDAKAGDHHGQEDGTNAAEGVVDATRIADDRVAKHHGCEHGSHIGTEQVGAHTCYVAHVVAHVVGDGGRVAGVVFGDTCFHLTHEVGAYVGSLRVDTAAHTGKQCDGFGAEREAGEHFKYARHGDVAAAACVIAVHKEDEKHGEQGAESEYGQTGNAEAHHRAAFERYVQGFGQAGAGGLRGAHVGFGGDAHAKETRHDGKEGSDDESHHDERVAGGHHGAEPAQEGGGDHHENTEYAVFRFEKRHGAVGNVSSDGAHFIVAGILFRYPVLENDHVQKSYDAENR